MAFNWFRRQHNDSSDTSSPEKEVETPPAVSTPSPTESATAPTTEAEQPVATDLLAFAKAAYQNIQQKQQSQSVETSSTEETTETTPETPTSETPAPEESVETVAEVSELTTPAPEENVETVAEVSELTTPAPEEATPPTPVTTLEENSKNTSTEAVKPLQEPANLSLLAKAAAERQAKQERLIATAIEVTEPEKIQAAASASGTSDIAEAIPEIEFDEGFLWSTEVLAAQGRRAEDVSIEEITWLKRLRQGLDKTRRNIVNQLKSIVGQGPLNQAGVAEIEALLLQADVGVEATDYIITALQDKLREEALPPEEAIAYLKQILRDMLDRPIQKSQKSLFAPEKDSFNIWLITGVNGAGKTTTIGKIAHLAQKSGYQCLIGAADTFRAAAVQQVKVWGDRSGVEVIANPGKNTDPAAVVFDAIDAATARQTELLLVDTAGRLQNKKNLMEELSKIRRIIKKKAPNAKIESLLVLDATLGQNGLRQAEVFSEAAELTGVVLTKLDSTAKGGVALAVVQQLGLPIRFIGAGEGIEDLRPFSSYEFVEALLSG
ncbi:MAG: signal recognition particle-docking protein FtsY [Pelatocladus maniniholoensis HA4357-MV3]|jgi:fused signal recognition particle receptor|uniref:Signal recognition particle receptor FtsY n=1 Tax=Pelatocladus maniniholoensis HA4357-MV3 TaxID=1117104 RepID=A0A9E3H5G6_9NOST|nr:signal recognition particle-docking protein FtsY [Pelatocladus maniniholoensis HA4357-MV3]BAZ68614.1 signal recognition particle-docking protein FtsY [Fischerella sp. NIES-4106]